ncbi:VOC family protein [Cryobacterium tepidiphilum]|uniref:VOC family protein n=1 Tax=Cryobacterium tepidiphilum TaxID=2486026 RepID=A0A3M8LMK5_9MICO|nr:VOC family protein [Cryobacterium tepidiphilum]RNE66710.1 VOC family protein [Cryobacterium tepidiphilum]
MTTRLNPYLSFRDTARDAMTFYQSVFGGDLTVSTFGDFQASEDPAEADKVMHSMLTSSNEFVLMASDTPNSMDAPSGGYSLSVSGEDEQELRAYWDKLVEGGSVTMPLEQAPWGDTFGMCTDKFGVNWMLNVAGQGGATQP